MPRDGTRRAPNASAAPSRDTRPRNGGGGGGGSSSSWGSSKRSTQGKAPVPRAAATAGAFAVYAVPQCLSTAPPLHAQRPFPLAPIRRTLHGVAARSAIRLELRTRAHVWWRLGGSWCCTVALDRTMPLCHGHAARHAQVKSCALIACGCAHSVCARSRQRVECCVAHTPSVLCCAPNGPCGGSPHATSAPGLRAFEPSGRRNASLC